jgi:hypothetical protein
MNALITALQQKFDPFMSWGDVVIDDWFWGSVFMPIHLQGMTDNSELEAGDKDRLLRHTIVLRIEAWCFHPPEKALTVQKTTLDVMTSHLEDLYYAPAVHFPCIYMAAPSHRMYKIAATWSGQLNVITVAEPPAPVTHYFEEKILIFSQGFVLDQYSTDHPGKILNWEYEYNGNVNQAGLVARPVTSSLPANPPLFISENQQFLIGGNGFYVQISLGRNLQLHFRPRWMLEANEQPIAPSLPYQMPTPK